MAAQTITDGGGNLTFHAHSVTREERERQQGHSGCVVWLTGLSGSGKSTLANALDQTLHAAGRRSFVLDGDNVRLGLSRNLGFSAEDRSENNRRVGEVAKLFSEAGVVVVTAFVSPFRADRDSVRALLEPGRFFEVFVDCSLEQCEARDPKGLYKRARAGEIKGFTGVDDPYEEPEAPELTLRADGAHTPSEMAAQLVAHLTRAGILSSPP